MIRPSISDVIMLDASHLSAREMLGHGTILTVAAAAVLLLLGVPNLRPLGMLGR